MKQIIILLFSILLISCGSRKVVINEVKKDSLSKIRTKTITDVSIKTQTKNDIIVDEFTITPLDSCKDVIVNGIRYKNAVLKYKKTKDNTIQVKDVKASKKEDIQQKTKTSVKEKQKYIEKKFNLLWLLLPIILYVGYRLIKKYNIFVV